MKERGREFIIKYLWFRRRRRNTAPHPKNTKTPAKKVHHSREKNKDLVCCF
jgi:hypothetical protein